MITAGLTAGYDQTKLVCKSPALGMREGVLTHVLSSVSAGVSASVLCAPFDLVKTKLMVTPEQYPGGVLDCVRKTLRADGARGLFLGVGANICRLVPSTMIYMPVMEQMRYVAGIGYFGETRAAATPQSDEAARSTK